MILNRLSVENFGKLQNVSIELTPGINTFCEENGWGKTTLAVFLKAMLFGLPASSKRALDENERKKYQPWQGGAYGGSLEFTSEKGHFRAERFFGSKESEDSFALYDLATNQPSSAYSDRLGEELFEIDADGFERSCYLSQRDLPEKAGRESLSAKLGGLLDANESNESYEEALDALERRRKYYKSGAKCYLATLEDTIADRKRDLESCRLSEKTMKELQANEADLCSERDAVRLLLNENREQLRLAGLSRERTAHVEQKKRMETELANLKRAKERESAEFCGKPPTGEQLACASAAFEERKTLQATLKTAQKNLPNPEELQQLRARFPSGIPTPQDVETAEKENRELLILHAKRREQEGNLSVNSADSRFDPALSSKLETAKKSLEAAEELAKKLPTGAQKRPGSAIAFGLICLLGGAGCSFASFLQDPMQPLIFLPAAVFLTLSVVAFAVAGKCKKRSAAVAAMQAKIKDLQQPAKNLFASLSMPEPRDLLQGLANLAERQREAALRAETARKKREESAATTAQCTAKSRRLWSFLKQYFPNLSPSDDYAEELTDLRRNADRLCVLEGQEASATAQISKMQSKIAAVEKTVREFCDLCCPAELTEAEFFAGASAHLSAYLRLESEIAVKTAELSKFVSEKLPGEAADAAPLDYDRIAAEGKIMEADLERYRQRLASTHNSIEKLAQDADRIPELEQQLSGLNEEYAEACANSEIILKTVSFLQKAKEAMTSRYLGEMQENLTDYLKTLMGDDSPVSTVNTDFEVHLREMGKSRPMEAFSQGWRDGVDFCLRLSLVSALSSGSETPFLLLDDPFVNLDSRRLSSALSLLSSLPYQILYLRCR